MTERMARSLLVRYTALGLAGASIVRLPVPGGADALRPAAGDP
jgi:hypothetical protein